MLDFPVVLDWLTFSGHFRSFQEIIDFLGLSKIANSFVPAAPRWFYKTAVTYSKEITLYLSQNSDYTMACINISGRGCRFLESFSDYEIDDILQKVQKTEGFKISRVDIAMDIIDNDFSITQLVDDTRAGNFTCRSKFYNIMESCDNGIKGSSLYFGKKGSNIFINIYDKRAERGYQSDSMDNWTRVEVRLRHENAEGFLLKYFEGGNDLGYIFVGIVNNYLRFLKPSDDSNKSRWDTAEYWQRILYHCEKVKVFYKPGVEYDFSQYERYLFNNCGSAIATYFKLHNPWELKNEIELRNIKPNAKQQFLIDNYIEGVDYQQL